MTQTIKSEIPAQAGMGQGDRSPLDQAAANGHNAAGAVPELDLGADLPDQPTLPGLESIRPPEPPEQVVPAVSDKERRELRGRQASANAVQTIGNIAAKFLGLRTRPVKWVGKGAAIGLGATAEATDRSRGRAASRRHRAAASAHGFGASAAAIKESRSARKVAGRAAKVVRHEANYRARMDKVAAHSRRTVRALRSNPAAAAFHLAGSLVEGAKASYSDWRVTKNAAKLAAHGERLDGRTAAVEARLVKGRAAEQRGAERREGVGLKPLDTVLDRGRLGRRRTDFNEHAAKSRKQADAILAARREAAERAAAREGRIAARGARQPEVEVREAEEARE